MYVRMCVCIAVFLMHVTANWMGYFFNCRLPSTLQESSIPGSLMLNIRIILQSQWNPKIPTHIPEHTLESAPALVGNYFVNRLTGKTGIIASWGSGNRRPALLISAPHLSQGLFAGSPIHHQDRAWQGDFFQLPHLDCLLSPVPDADLPSLICWHWYKWKEANAGSQRKKINFGLCSNCKEQTYTIPSVYIDDPSFSGISFSV